MSVSIPLMPYLSIAASGAAGTKKDGKAAAPETIFVDGQDKYFPVKPGRSYTFNTNGMEGGGCDDDHKGFSEWPSVYNGDGKQDKITDKFQIDEVKAEQKTGKSISFRLAIPKDANGTYRVRLGCGQAGAYWEFTIFVK